MLNAKQPLQTAPRLRGHALADKKEQPQIGNRKSSKATKLKAAGLASSGRRILLFFLTFRQLLFTGSIFHILFMCVCKDIHDSRPGYVRVTQSLSGLSLQVALFRLLLEERLRESPRSEVL